MIEISGVRLSTLGLDTAGYSLAYVGEIPYLLQLMESGCGEDAFKKNAWFENIAARPSFVATAPPASA